MTKLVLTSLSASAGFLEHCHVEFAPGLTCIIGARGTCKTTLIESIRFVFNQSEERVRALVGESESRGESWYGLIEKTLGPGSIRCEVQRQNDGNSIYQVLEREVEGETRLFRDGVREHTQRDMLGEIEIFSQGDLQRIADDGNNHLRLELVDRPNKSEIKRLHEEREKKTSELLKVGPELRTLRGHIQTLEQELQAAPVIDEQLRQAKESAPKLSPEMEEERIRFEHRRRIVERLGEIEEARLEILSQTERTVAKVERVNDLSSSVRGEAIVDPSPIFPTLTGLESSLSDLSVAIEQLATSSLPYDIEQLRSKFEEQNESFYQQRKQENEVNEALKKQQHLEQQKEHFDRQKQDLTAKHTKEKTLLERRAQLRRAINEIDDQILNLRVSEIDSINQEHGETVYLALETGLGAPQYVEQIKELLSGSRIRSQDEVAAALANQFSSATLIDVVESGSGQRFADILNRDLGQMNRVVAHLGDHADLYGIEAAPPAAHLEITLFDKGEPKHIGTLSKGQKATALLPLILRPLPYPLLIDQPEDDLDNHFIISSLIDTIHKLKEHRQVIFVTHNANIPVLGSADRVIVMEMRSPTVAEVPLIGTVDTCKREILDLLEGGAEAFMRREKRYGELLSSSASRVTPNGESY